MTLVRPLFCALPLTRFTLCSVAVLAKDGGWCGQEFTAPCRSLNPFVGFVDLVTSANYPALLQNAFNQGFASCMLLFSLSPHVCSERPFGTVNFAAGTYWIPPGTVNGRSFFVNYGVSLSHMIIA